MIQELIDTLNKVKEDKRPQDYKIVFFDDIERETKFDLIKNVDALNLFIERDGEEFSLPIHKIRKIIKDDKLIWMR